MTVMDIEKEKACRCLYLRCSWYIGVEVSLSRDSTVELRWELSYDTVGSRKYLD